MTEQHPFFALIMAGGTGSRFWPLSRKSHPKQLLDLFHGQPMIRDTFQRLEPSIPPERILVITSAHLTQAVSDLLPELPPSNIIAEPAGRNTAPCIGLACHIVEHMCTPEQSPVLGVFAADHYVARPEAFRTCVDRARHAATTSDAILTLGIVPTRPETGYGYLRVAAHDDADPLPPKVAQFVEKPNATTALSYLRDGSYLWNAGIFITRTDVMLQAFQNLLPTVAQGLQTIRDDLDQDPTQLSSSLARHFPSLQSISIDYGIMERTPHVRVVPTEAGWSDVGHWAALPDLLPPDDEHGNITRGNTLHIDTHNTVVLNTQLDHLVAVLGLHDTVVVHTQDATLVLPQNRSQDVRAIVDTIDPSFK